jgi:predicted transcriptional regulator
MSTKGGDAKFTQLSAESRFVDAMIGVVGSLEDGRNMTVWEARELAHDIYRYACERVKMEASMGARGFVAQAVASATVSEAPAVAVANSVHPDHLVCLDCGRQYETLTRHIWAQHGLTEDEYRKRYKLPHYYPMTSRRYREMRARIAFERHETGWSAPKEEAAIVDRPETRVKRPGSQKPRRSNKAGKESRAT